MTNLMRCNTCEGLGTRIWSLVIFHLSFVICHIAKVHLVSKRYVSRLYVSGLTQKLAGELPSTQPDCQQSDEQRDHGRGFRYG